MGNSYEYDLALSYAGEDREYVEQVAILLKDAGIRVFYDQFEAARLLGKNLYEHFTDLFEKKARFCVVFASKAYVDKDKRWTTLERRSAQERAFREREEYILPARFDDSCVPGIGATTGYADLRILQPSQFVDVLLTKLCQPAEAVLMASAAWLANGYDTNWLLPEPELPETVIANPTAHSDERLASFLVANLLYYGRTYDALAWVKTNKESRYVATMLVQYAGHRMRRVKYRAAGLLYTMDSQVRDEGIAFLRLRGANPEILNAISVGDFRQVLGGDESLPPLLRTSLVEELESIARANGTPS